MGRPRAPIAELVTGELKLTGALARYLTRVRRLRAGDAFVAFDPTTSREADVEVVWAEADTVTVRAGALREGSRKASRDLTWIQGLAKGDKCDAVVRDATELGVTRIVVASTRRSVVRLDPNRASQRQARWARIAGEAARQSGRSDVPRVDAPCAWNSAIEHVTVRGALGFCLWEHATQPLGPALLAALDGTTPLAFACGPEGGLEEQEVAEARAHGWLIASLGPLALRTETVAAAVLGAVRVLSET
jgi:16S rRNA (uracil1498-N3)-methyltransferase